MLKIIYKFCQQGGKQLDLFKQITSLPPTYANFRKLNISFDESLRLFDFLQSKKTHQSAQILNNLLTYVRKVHNRAVLRSRQHLIEHIIKYMPEDDFEMLPALLSNIYYTENPEKFLPQACGALIKQAPLMDIRLIANCAYSAAKIARKNISSDLQNEKVMLYHSVNLALKNMIPIIQLKLSDCQDPQTLMEIMVAYSKMELPDLFENIINQLSTFNYPEFGRVETQILFTASKSGIETPAKIDLIRKLYNCFEDAVHHRKISLPSMIVGLHTLQNQATEDLVNKCVVLYCEKYKAANIMDLGMMTNVLFRKGMMTAQYAQILTDSFEALKQNVDMNCMMLMIQNMSTMINLKLLEKKFLNMFLISAKVKLIIFQILKEKGKVNRRFFEDFKTETRQIQNEEIRDKFKQIERIMMA